MDKPWSFSRTEPTTAHPTLLRFTWISDAADAPNVGWLGGWTKAIRPVSKLLVTRIEGVAVASIDVGFQADACGYGGTLCDLIIALMSRFSKMSVRDSPVLQMARSTMARPRSSARIAWLGNSTRNTG